MGCIWSRLSLKAAEYSFVRSLTCCEYSDCRSEVKVSFVLKLLI